MSEVVKVPAIPPAPLTLDHDTQLITVNGPLWRVFRTRGPHALEWDELRHWGPADDMRFDPHPPPSQHHPDIGVMYSALVANTAFAEVFQEFRVIDRDSGGATLVSWRPSRPLSLLDLTSNWPVQNRGAAAMMMDDKTATQAWAAAINAELGAIVDGLYHLSSITSEPMVTLFSRTEVEPAFPLRPSFIEPLSSASLDQLIEDAADFLNYEVAAL